MAKIESPAYLMYPDDILSSGRVASLRPLEELWYRRAIDLGWKNGGMPSDPKDFAGWVGRGCTVESATKIIAKFYVPHKKDPSLIVNERQEKERKLFLRKRKQKSEAGKRGMAKRWNSKSNGDNSVITEDNISIPISNSNKKEESPEANASALHQDVWNSFRVLLQKRGESEKAARGKIGKLIKKHGKEKIASAWNSEWVRVEESQEPFAYFSKLLDGYKHETEFEKKLKNAKRTHFEIYGQLDYEVAFTPERYGLDAEEYARYSASH